ncbi:MAG: GNAT family N-acetyltransferase [Alphaproteobacteria bacterium]
MLYFSRLKKEDLHKYSRLVRPEVNFEDYYCHKTLLKEWNNIQSYVLMNEEREWIGWCAVSSQTNVCNPNGSNIIGSVIFPKFRNKGYAKYLYKIIFEKTAGKNKLVRINPFNDALKKISERYGFTPHQTCDIWNTYCCKSKDCPKELKELCLTEVNL